MKKLMIAAATAAMVGGAFASPKSQVYDFTATLKTTACKEAKVNAALAKYFDVNGVSNDAGAYEKGDAIGLRKQASRKILGVIWGCDCPTIENPMWRTYNGKTVGGFLFWDQAINDYLRVTRTTFGWKFINRIDAMNKCEGIFKLYNDVDGQAIALYGAGFGTVKDTGCETYVPSMSGSVVGYRQPNDGDFANCAFCDAGNGCVVEALCDMCSDAHMNPDLTVAFGTWNLKYNKAMAKKLNKTPYLSAVYKFKKAGQAKETLALIENLVKTGVIAERLTEDHGEELDITQIAGLQDDDGNYLFPNEANLELVEDFDWDESDPS